MQLGSSVQLQPAKLMNNNNNNNSNNKKSNSLKILRQSQQSCKFNYHAHVPSIKLLLQLISLSKLTTFLACFCHNCATMKDNLPDLIHLDVQKIKTYRNASFRSSQGLKTPELTTLWLKDDQIGIVSYIVLQQRNYKYDQNSWSQNVNSRS